MFQDELQTFSPSCGFIPWIGGPTTAEGTANLGSTEQPFYLGCLDDGQEAVRNCRLVFGRKEVSCDDAPVQWSKGEGVIYASVTHGKNAKLEVKKGHKLPDQTVLTTYRRLYDIGDDGIIKDFRFMPVIVAAN